MEGFVQGREDLLQLQFIDEKHFGANNAQNQLFTSINKHQFSCELAWFTKSSLYQPSYNPSPFGSRPFPYLGEFLLCFHFLYKMFIKIFSRLRRTSLSGGCLLYENAKNKFFTSISKSHFSNEQVWFTKWILWPKKCWKNILARKTHKISFLHL